MKGKFNKLLVTTLVVSMIALITAPSMSVFAQKISEKDKPKQTLPKETTTKLLDFVDFGESTSEKSHDFKERLSVSGVDTKNELEYKDSNGLIAGGGLGQGLTYRYVKPTKDTVTGKLEFTVKADPTQQNYITIRLSGTQQGRGNLLLYGPDGDASILNPKPGYPYSELDNGFQEGSPYLGRYYYSTYRIPQEMVSSTGVATLSIIPTGSFNAYGNGKYNVQTQNSKYIYSAAIHTDPYYVPADNLKGVAPKGVAATNSDSATPYDYLLSQQKQTLETVMSWQLYGDKFDSFKNDDNAYLEGAVVTYTPIESLASFSGTKDQWSRKIDQNAINFQNWSPMMSTEILANAFMNNWDEKYYQSEEMLDRVLKAYDFFARAQDSQGAWCVPTKGEDAGKWIGADLTGSGTRGKGEAWPLLSLGTDSLVQTMIQLDYYIQNSDNQEVKDMYNSFLDEKVDSNLTGKLTITRRQSYIEMFAKIRDYLAKTGNGNFYDPESRAGTANQDFGFAYDANRVVKVLTTTIKDSKVDTENSIPDTYKFKDDVTYLNQLKYKFGEMVDGQKWFSENGLGLEGGASQGGWAGEYGQLLLKTVNKYAETAKGDPSIESFLGDISAKNYDTAQYFLLPAVGQDGLNTLDSQMFAGSRSTGHGIKKGYPIGSYTALKYGDTAALAVMMKYMEDNTAFAEDFIGEMNAKSPHVHTRLIELQQLLKHYKEVETLKGELEQKDEIPYLPMDDRHEDFAFADIDAQSIVFKNKEDKVYITLNYRRENWQYNNYARVRLLNGSEERLADITTTTKGGVYSYKDTDPTGNEYTHYRSDGFTQADYGKYVVAMNQSKDKESVGQTGKVYDMNLLGIKEAKDLMTGKIYKGEKGKDIKIQVQPSQTVILEVLDKASVSKVSVKYVSGDILLGNDSIPAVLGESIVATAKTFDGYKLEAEASTTVVVDTDETKNTVEFNYSKNDSPVFNTGGITGKENPLQTINLNNATGEVKYDATSNPISITSTGDTTKKFSSTFLYKEVTGDAALKVRLSDFTRTASDSDYFSLIFTDSLDLANANYVQINHYTNNNNILLTSHKDTQGDAITGYWGPDMNNKKVPIFLKLTKNGTKFNYEYSLDEEVTYEKTSKPEITFDMSKKMYVGVAMYSGTGLTNTANISKLNITSDDIVMAPSETGKEIKIDLGIKDTENDTIKYNLFGLPIGATINDETKKISFTPTKNGSYMIKAEANDIYHTSATEKLKEVVVGKSETTAASDGTISKIDKIKDFTVTEGSPISFDAKATGALVTMAGNYTTNAVAQNGNFTWNTKSGESGVYNVAVTYTFADYIVTKIVKITVNEPKASIDYSVDRKVEITNVGLKKIKTDKEYIYKVETKVPLDGFGSNVSVSNLPKGAVYNSENRSIIWTPTKSDKKGNKVINIKLTKPNGKITNAKLTLNVV